MKILSPLLLLLLTVGCQDKVLGLLDNATPLAQIHVKVTGDLQPWRPLATLSETPHLRVAIVWAAVYLPDPFCLIYQTLPLDPSATAVAQAGCRDDFGFVPTQVGESVALSADGTATLDLINLPSAGVLVGEVTSRVGYASILVFDDRNNNGTLELHRGSGGGGGGQGGGGGGGGPGNPGGPGGCSGLPDTPTPTVKGDVVYGASFVSMTKPDQRIAYMEGPFDPTNVLYGLFYPRTGCDGPTAGFSILSAGGFSAVDALKAAAGLGQVAEDPASCGVNTLDSVVTIALQAPASLGDVACSGSNSVGAIRYTKPNSKCPPDLKQPWACMPTVYGPCALGIQIPGQDCSKTDTKSRPALAVASPPGDCKSTTYYVLKGCQDLSQCDTPVWDLTTPANPPPAWWPCDIGANP